MRELGYCKAEMPIKTLQGYGASGPMPGKDTLTRLRRIFLYGLLLIALMAAGWYRWIWLHKDDPTAVELWGRMDKAAQEKLSVEINRSFIRLHPGCWRSALEIKSYPEAIVIKVKCSVGKNQGNDVNMELIKYTEEVQ